MDTHTIHTSKRSYISPVYTITFTFTKLACYKFTSRLSSAIEVVQNKLARCNILAVYTASCNRTGSTNKPKLSLF